MINGWSIFISLFFEKRLFTTVILPVWPYFQFCTGQYCAVEMNFLRWMYGGILYFKIGEYLPEMVGIQIGSFALFSILYHGKKNPYGYPKFCLAHPFQESGCFFFVQKDREVHLSGIFSKWYLYCAHTL